MPTSKQTTVRAKAKKNIVFEAAHEVFAQYGYKRTTMNDIAQAADISRPALYLIFDNKENLFYELVANRLDISIEKAKSALSVEATLNTRFIDALLAFEKAFYEPVSSSPHGAELMDTSQSLAADVLTKGFSKLVTAFSNTLKEAEKCGEANFQDTPLTPKSFVELLITALGGIKKKAKTTTEFRKQTTQVAEIFLATITD
ncbi:TetR/AcrR family transcriptional regulator [Gammaproteobacteria bacterium]|nr:TetR/AcrR family transcriptional regulator [Gammaproteobacteria bacterium]